MGKADDDDVMKLAFAVSQFQAAEALLEKGKPAFIAPILFLIGFAVENGLKAYLRNKGWAEKKLREHPLRHDLTRLADECEASGLQLTKMEREFIDVTSHHHTRFEGRYPSEAEIVEAFRPELAVSLCDQIFRKILRHMDPSRVL